MSRRLRLWILVGLLVLPFALAADGNGSDRDQDLRARVLEYWGALIKRDFASSYTFTSPAYRSLFTPTQYAARYGRGADWQHVDVVGIHPSGEDAARVDVKIHFRFYKADMDKSFDMSTIVTESWIHADNQWWFVPDD